MGFSSDNLPAEQGDSRKRNVIRRRLLAVSIVLAVALIAISCATVNRTVLAPPNIPGAEFAGSQTCAECHDRIVRDFKTATHARLKAPGDNATNVGCESCHGPGSIHNQSGGKYGTIVNPHKSPEACFQCHLDKRAQFNLPHHHPVLEGKVSCSDCHNPHYGPAVKAGGTSLLSENATCGQCHTAQFGPCDTGRRSRFPKATKSLRPSPPGLCGGYGSPRNSPCLRAQDDGAAG